MLKNFRKILAVVIVIAICASFTACHQAGETAVTVDGEKFTSGVYACALLAADGEAMEKASKILEENQVASDNKGYLETKIEEKEYSVWVKERAIEILKEFVAAKRLCEENKVETAAAIDEAKSTAELYWQYYGLEPHYTANGVGLESFKTYMAYQSYANTYFDSLYGEKGKTPITEDEITNHIKANYGYADVLSVPLTGLEDEQKTEVQTTMTEYADRIYAGESFAKIYAEAKNEEYTADETDTGNFSNTLAAVWSAEGTQYENEYYKTLADIKEGEVKVVPFTSESGEESILLILRGDIMNEKNSQLESVKNATRKDLKGDETTKKIDERAAKLTVDESTHSTKQFKVANIDYTEGIQQ